MDHFDTFWECAKPQGLGTYWPRPTEGDQTIDWSSSIYNIERKVRAFGKFDTNAVIDGQAYFIHDVTVWEENHSYPPGTTIHQMNREYVVAAKDGFVCVRFFEKVGT